MCGIPASEVDGYLNKEIRLFSNFLRLRWQREIGLIDRTQRQYIFRKPPCEKNGRMFISVGLDEIRPAITLLVIGTAVSFIIMLVEKLKQSAFNFSQH